MRCPRCKAELSIHVLRPDYHDFCMRCEFAPRRARDWFLRNIEARYCPRIQDGDLTEEEFEEWGCDDCVYDCFLSQAPWDMTTDEEGNCVYPDDLEDWEKEDLD